MKVRIIKSEAWHKGMIGRIFEITTPDARGYANVIGGEHDGNGLLTSDYEVVRTGNMFPQPMKFRVNDKAHSEQIQRAVFKEGGKWNGDDRAVVQYTDSKFLFVSQSGRITRSDYDSTFDSNSNIEHFIDNDGDISIRKPEPKTKIVTFDGKKYEVPGYTKFVTRDGTGRGVYAWERKPQWMGIGSGYYDTDTSNNRTRVNEYVEPLPEGALIVEVA